jgi:hypothetical protein
VDVTLDTVNNTDFGPTGLPVVTDSTVEIQGNGFTIRRDAGADDFRIFRVRFGTLTVRDTTVSGGRSAGMGGGILSVSSDLTIADSTVSANSAGSGGGIYIQAGTASVHRSTLTGNSATNGGGIGNGGGTLTINGSTLAGNSAGQGGGILSVGTVSQIEISDSTLRRNSTTGNGGGISIQAGTAIIRRSTFTGNSATSGGGVTSGPDGNVTLYNTTLSGNSAGTGGGIDNQGTLTLVNTTLAGNTGEPSGLMASFYAGLLNTILANAAGGSNCSGAEWIGNLFDANLADDGTCGTIPATLSGLDPTLADNGGPTMTHALFPGSNAIDNVVYGSCSLATDQRGGSRENYCDSGAYEFRTCDDLSFSGDMIDATETRWNCKKIVADFTVLGTGDLTLRAGTGIELQNGTSVATGGALSLVNDSDLQVGRAVFVTSTTSDGILGGLSGADTDCQQLADAQALSGPDGAPPLLGNFKAWLSDSSNGPADSFFQSPAPYFRLDGVRVADNWADLTDGSLQVPINLDEYGNAAGLFAWTNTLPDGSRSSETFHCSNWTNGTTDQEGVYGFTPNSVFWTDTLSTLDCDQQAALYCFEQ